MNANTDSLYDFIHQFTYLDAIHFKPGFLDQEEFAEVLLSLKDIQYLSFDFELYRFSLDLCSMTFKATTVFLEVGRYIYPSVLKWLASCFPNLEEFGIYMLGIPRRYAEGEESDSKSIFELWEKLMESCPNLLKIHQSTVASSQCQIEKKYPHIQFDNKFRVKCDY
ncbi:hypothetical protein DSO57_1001485 [Entomophthora muscae]|uniref:Uncharacterized protein n=1 Tax=Entomophthora muscae TaxID=34485 RepID=A0ACC2UU72_9FUNG|nr:hypothetical protein DSO57_1001485 [Entomophthora muscae]